MAEGDPQNDHSDNDAALLGAASGGGVDYEALEARGREVEAEILADYTNPPPKKDRDDRLAFFINAYNAAAAAVALRRRRKSALYRKHALDSLIERFLFFFVERVPVAGKPRTLGGLEYRTIRGLAGSDPRYHFAIVCASKGCPPLREGRYHGDALDDELETAARAFLQPGGGYRLDRDAGVLWLNRIFKWYRKDFRSMGGLHAVVARYAPEEDAAWVEAERPRIRFMAYDWSLNVAKTDARTQKALARVEGDT